MMKLRVFTLIIALLSNLFTYSQVSSLIQKLEMHVDTDIYQWPTDAVIENNQKVLPFGYRDENEICEIEVWPVSKSIKLELIHTADYALIDSLTDLGNSYRFKIRFSGLTEQNFLKFSFRNFSDTMNRVYDIPLQPFTNTSASLYLRDDELFIGEEKTYEITCTNPANIRITGEWISTPEIDYQVGREKEKILLRLVPNQLGTTELIVPLMVRKPYLSDKSKLEYDLPPIRQTFFVKASRLQFLNIEPKDITLDDQAKREGVEVQIDDSRLLQLNKTYRVEDQEEPGGPLIAEIFTRRKLANNRVLCTLRPYNYHSKAEGYLYIKDGDLARFITNQDITHATTIEKISILRDGGEWKTGNVIYPGETLELRLEGRGLYKASFRFEDLTDISPDTLNRSETQATFKLKVPIDIKKRVITIYNHQQSSGKFLTVAEYQKPREFDYLYINYGEIGRRVSGIREPIHYQKILKDVLFTYNDQLIDSAEKLYGKQYLILDVRVTGKRNELIEMRTIEGLVICPGESSPRHEFYSPDGCLDESISLNKYLSRKTYDLDEWSKISLTLRNDITKSSEEAYKKDIDIILRRSYSFDIEVSFPAGLVTIAKQDDGQIGFGSLSGISMAMIAQFSFYHPEKIATYRPYKIGAGFLAFNAFNFSDNVDDRDVGIVILGSLYPTTKDVKLSFPLYVGGGYFMKDQKWFLLIGPGIRVRL